MIKRLLLVIVSALLGTLLGAGAALAHTDPQPMVSGWNVYSDSHSQPSYSLSFDEDHFAWANATFTTFKINDTGYWNGYATSNDVWFGILAIWDEQGNNTQTYNAFLCDQVNGINKLADTPWEYNQLQSPQDDEVVAEVVIWDGQRCPLDINLLGRHGIWWYTP